MKNWNLSYECITSEAARCILRERLEDDPSFALSISEPHIRVHTQDEDTFVDGPTLDDDLVLSPNNLVAGLGNGNMDLEGLSAAFDEQGDYAIHGRLDKEWTDVDAEGETDDELFIYHDIGPDLNK
jgi:hypothetical protein